ncbi:MAG: hypothetical protein IJN54_03325 [Lachnospiraceae bacterium]|nr:hypothetical protein [Lachnospiraceae bacterium]
MYVGGYKGELDTSHLPIGSENILAKLLQNMDWTTEYAIEQELKEQKEIFNETHLKNDILSYKDLDWYIMTYIRVEVIRALIKGGITVTVYGSNWEKYEKDKDFIGYDLKHLEQLPEIIRNILKNDNIEMRTKAYHKAMENHRWLQRVERLEVGAVKK